jgi:hypothetical protein
MAEIIRDEEKLIRHIAESHPVAYQEYHGNETQFCFYCHGEAEENQIFNESLHKPGCWYVWCCEWVEKRDAGEIFLSTKEVMERFFPKWYKEQQEERERERDKHPWKRLMDEQNTGDESG